ncbi:hypothetical protein D5F53_03615 [Paenibacillus lautus]|uniref:Uncharacterized protein n=1 Tax=Paenibacillus lautus TaxID=1401 RepID=A0A385TG63_PAELA|nr:hypothetical protein D5F53_03615 [Paenibacillus lautus]
MWERLEAEPKKEEVSVEETWRSPLKPGKYRKIIILFSRFQQRPERIHPPQTRPTNLDIQKRKPSHKPWDGFHRYFKSSIELAST